MKIFSWFIMSCFLFSFECYAENQDITQKDLDALILQKNWLEVIQRAKEVPPEQRKEAWNESVTEALLLMLEELKKNRNEMRILFVMDSVFTGYSSFLESPRIIPKLKESTITLLKNCYDSNFRSRDVKYCTVFFTNHIDKLPQDPNYLMEVGEYIRKSGGNAESLLFFERSTKIDSSDTMCGHEGLYAAADWAMHLSSNKHDHTALSKRIFFQNCWDYFKIELIEDSIYQDGYYLDNLCGALKEKQIPLPNNNKC